MNRKLGAAALATLTLSAWIFSASACSSGGNGDEPSASAGDDVDPGDEPDTDTDSGSDPAPGDVIDPSPFDPPAPTDGEQDPAEPETGDPADEPGDTTDADPSTTDNGPEGQRPIGSGSDTASIAGVWDYSRTTDAGTDTVIVEIDAAGGLIEYDYQADDVGSGADCNIVRTASIASRGNDRYDIQDSSTLPGSTSIDDVLITADGAEITFRYLGDDTDPQFGGGQIGVTERYPATSGENVRGANNCDDGDDTARG